MIKSLIHGWGLFANAPFTRGQMVIEFAGEVLSQSVANDRELMSKLVEGMKCSYNKVKMGSC